jgi:hypothetical protein
LAQAGGEPLIIVCKNCCPDDSFCTRYFDQDDYAL